MNSHEAKIDYDLPLTAGRNRLHLDLFPAIPSGFGQPHDAMVEHFQMVESDELPGLMTLRAKCNLAQFTSFFGGSWQEALQRWPTLAFFHEYRKKHGPDTYSSVDQWQMFYQLVDAGIAPMCIEVAFIEHH